MSTTLSNLPDFARNIKLKSFTPFLVGLPWSEDPLQNKIFVQEEYKSTLALIDQLLKICKPKSLYLLRISTLSRRSAIHQSLNFGLSSPHTLSGWSNYLMSPEDAF